MRDRFLHLWRRHKPYVATGVLLVLAIGVTAYLRQGAVSTAVDQQTKRQQTLAREALATIETDFERRVAQLQGRVRGLATDSVVVRALVQWEASGERSGALMRRVAGLRLQDRRGVEVYAPTPRLLAWKGLAMPLDAGPDADRFLEEPQTLVVTDGDVRQALVAWWPVRHEGRTIGAVRAVQVVRYQPPVQNRYIRGYSLEAEWSRLTGESVDLELGASVDRPEGSRTAESRPLASNGDVVGRVTVYPPSAERLVQIETKRYDDLIVLWVVLLGLWLLTVGWHAYLAAASRDGPRLVPAFGRLALVLGGWVGFRYVLLALDVPARWMAEDAFIAPLFDPTHLASTFGGGIMRSTGDLLVTGVFAMIVAVGMVHLGRLVRVRVDTFSEFADYVDATESSRAAPSIFFAVLIAVIGSVLGLVFVLAQVVRRAVLDSTLDYFSRTGLLPEPLVLVVLCSLFLLAVAAVLAGTTLSWSALHLMLRHRPVRWPRGVLTLCVALVTIGIIVAFFVQPQVYGVLPIPVGMTFLGVVVAATALGMTWSHGGVGQLTLRGLLPSVIALTLILYPMLYSGMDTQRRDRMVDAAQSFEEGRDPRVLFSIEQVLKSARDDLAPMFDPDPVDGRAASSQTPRMPPSAPVRAAALQAQALRVDSVATRLMQRSLLASLTTYEASLTLIGDDGRVKRRFSAAGMQTRRPEMRAVDRAAFQTLRRLYRLQGGSGLLVEQVQADSLTGRRSPSLLYAGILPLTPDTTAGPWVLVRAEPRSLLPGTGTDVPAVLLPDGSYSDLYAELSLAEFRDGTLVRSLGRDFGRAKLSPEVQASLAQDAGQWRSETVRERHYLTYFHRATDLSATGTIAVRIPAVLAFDHLYYILRLTVAGLCVSILIYLAGLVGRYRHGLLPAPKIRFRDKVLSAFLAVGVVSMIAVGVVGVQVVTGENERVIERRLHDHLNRVEETLALEARPGEMIYRVAERSDVDSLAARVGLDLHVYEDGRLVSTSRPRLVRDRLVNERLPARAYVELYEEAYRFTTAPAYAGSFQYVVGYQALPGEDGRPEYVVAVPTLAQQERIEEEQARTLAYLFGALLMLVVAVMLTALLLANALARPIAQLKEGLEAVGEGRFARVLPVNTRDEIGDLVRTFNEMREQLRESRRKLAQQERELAWREMARQVAHEIKNPLTPMKLSIQHMRRAYERTGKADDKFESLFKRITSTLIEQIEALVRIANEFSSFARLPTRVLEPLDLNEVIREAADLMREEADAVSLDLDLHDEPMVVEADREELRRIFINLVKNAIQAIPEHRDGRIELQTAPVSGSGDASPAARCTVTDNGTGIPEDLREKIFQPNFSTKTSGTGLGLAIARKSIEELDGEIGFDTVEGEGTTFWIRLPLSEEATVEA